MMDTNEAIKLLKGMQGPLQDYADMVGAPESAKGIRYVYPDPEDYAIEAAISALEEQEQHRWIPVEERLPEARKDVLVCVKTGWILVAWYGSGGKGGIYRHQMWAHFMKILLPGCRCRNRIRRRREDEKMLWNLQMAQA